MNHWPDGRKLTPEDMSEIGVEAGLWTREEAAELPGKHEKNTNSFLIQATAKVRWDMMWEGKLYLATAVREIPDVPKPIVEAWVYELETEKRCHSPLPARIPNQGRAELGHETE